MTTTLATGADSVSVSWDYEIVLPYGNAVQANTLKYAKALTNGTGAGNADKVYLATAVTVAASGTLTVNLASCLDPFGAGFTFGKLKGIYVENSSAGTATSILVGGGSQPVANWLVPSTAQLRIRNGMAEFLGNCGDNTGYAVTASNYNLLITNEDGANAAVVNIRLVGASSSTPLVGMLDFSNPFNSGLFAPLL